MRIGIKFDLRNPQPWARPVDRHYSQVLEWCEEADRLGVGSIWLSEHHFFEDGYLPQPLPFAAAIAARTKRARIGTGVLLAPLRPPLLIAEEAAVVDLVSQGRLDLGLGAGHIRTEFEAYGADIAQRFVATDRCVTELRKIWSDDRTTPKPFQRRLPIYLGYTGPKGAYRAGLMGEGLLCLEPDRMDTYRQGLADGGHDPSLAQIAGQVHMMVVDDPDEAWSHIKHPLAWRWDTYNRYAAEGAGLPAPPPIDPEVWISGDTSQQLPGLAPPTYEVLTAEQAVKKLQGELLPGYPITDLHFYCISGVPETLIQRQIELICQRVIPAVTSWERSIEAVS